MKAIIPFANAYLLRSARRALVGTHGAELYHQVRQSSRVILKDELLPASPELGTSLFDTSWIMGLPALAWHLSLKRQGWSDEAAGRFLWLVYEAVFLGNPRFLNRWIGRFYLGRTVARARELAQGRRQSPRQDWRVDASELPDGGQRIVIRECFLLRFGTAMGARGAFPWICRLDHQTAHYFGQRFVRTKTLADGDDACECLWYRSGSTAWPIADPAAR
ncbi:MAG: L-2-amino-thiazoline-4-carboxylic acid hydrolase [Myxococcales bacterium]